MFLSLSLPRLEYTITRPHPHNHWFLFSTIILFSIILPVLVIVNRKLSQFKVVTLGYELVPSLQPQFQHGVALTGWWGSARLPQLLGGSTPPCEPKSLGKGDTFRMAASLFDYAVISTWNTSKANPESRVQNQERVEYRGESFANCGLNGARFDYSLVEDTQTITVGVICRGTPTYPIYVSMETKMVFSWLLGKDLVGQYYGPDLSLWGLPDAEANHYRELAYAVLEVISTDSPTIIRGQHLSSPVLSITSFAKISLINDFIGISPLASSLTYANGTAASWPTEANLYTTSIINLMTVAAHTVMLDLGIAGTENIYRNPAAVNKTLGPNRAPPGISPADWAQNSVTFHYGSPLPPYQTWAETLRAGQVITPGNVTGLPNGSSMDTTYLCPTYRLKQTSSLMTSIFVGTSTMVLSVWGLWMFVTALIARRIKEPSLVLKDTHIVARQEENAEFGGAAQLVLLPALGDKEYI
ncbi:hypothetical protein BDV93DRAFT_595634 [Ceratobasidium sp. AG-I]|nr:hypothetical protein BDV93DRAFT_595634 [Ceratobasidium sp. AG-I]